MLSPNPPYPAAFRQQMIELERAGRGVTELAREFGCNASSIHHWVNAADPKKAANVSAAASSCPPLRCCRSVWRTDGAWLLSKSVTSLEVVFWVTRRYERLSIAAIFGVLGRARKVGAGLCAVGQIRQSNDSRDAKLPLVTQVAGSRLFDGSCPTIAHEPGRCTW